MSHEFRSDGLLDGSRKYFSGVAVQERYPLGDAEPAGGWVDATPARGSVPGFPTHDVEGVSGPSHDVEGVGTLDRIRAAFGDDPGDPGGRIGRDVGDLGAALLPEQIEEGPQGGHIAARCRPDEAPGVVVDHHAQVAMPALVGNLVDTDRKDS